jgi:hypothetical protein
VPPEIEQVLSVPSWDEVLQVLRSDAMRGYRVDIETDSTVQADVARLKTNAAEFVQGFGGFIQAVGPAVQAGAMPMDVVADLLTAFARNFKLGRQAEDALERMGKIAAQPAPQQDQGAAAEAQAEQQRVAMEMQVKQAEVQAKAQLDQEKLALEAQRMAMEAQIKEREIAVREAEVALKAQVETARLQDSQVARAEARQDALMPEREALVQSNEGALTQLAAALASLGQSLEMMQQQQTNTAQIQMQALAQLSASMTAPKRVVRGPDGRAMGVETVIN